MQLCRAGRRTVLHDRGAGSRMPTGGSLKGGAVRAGVGQSGQELGSSELKVKSGFSFVGDPSCAYWWWPGSHSSQL